MGSASNGVGDALSVGVFWAITEVGGPQRPIQAIMSMLAVDQPMESTHS